MQLHQIRHAARIVGGERSASACHVVTLRAARRTVKNSRQSLGRLRSLALSDV